MNNVDLSKYSLEELRKLNKVIVAEIKKKQRSLSVVVGEKLAVGDKVTVNHPSVVGKIFLVEKVKNVNAVVFELGSNPEKRYNVKMAILEKI